MSITAKDIAGALRKCETQRWSILDDHRPEDVELDGSFNFERAARLLTRLARMRARTIVRVPTIDGDVTFRRGADGNLNPISGPASQVALTTCAAS